MNKLQHQLNIARPPLKKAAPLTHAICWGYVGVNLVLGTGLAYFYNARPALSVANYLPYKAWGILFILIGFVMAYGLLINSWNLTKRSQLVGLTLKAFWAIALIIRSFTAPETIVITALWLFFTYVQAVTYIHFVPNTPLADRAAKGNEDGS